MYTKTNGMENCQSSPHSLNLKIMLRRVFVVHFVNGAQCSHSAIIMEGMKVVKGG